MAKIIKIIVGEEEREVTIRSYESHTIKFVEEQTRFQKLYKEKSDDTELLKEFIKFKNDLLLECINLTKEELKLVDNDDRNKLRQELQKQLFPEAGDDKLFF